MKGKIRNLATALEASRIPSPTRQGILSHAEAYFNLPQYVALGAAANIDLERSNKAVRYADGRPESSHPLLALRDYWKSIAPVMHQHGKRHGSYDRVLFGSVGVLLHDQPENNCRDEALRPALEAKRSQFVTRGLRGPLLEDTTSEAEYEIKRTLLPKVRNQYIENTVAAALLALEPIAEDFYETNNAPLEKLLGTTDVQETLRLLLDFYTPWKDTNSVLTGTYADTPRAVFAHEDTPQSIRAKHAFIRGKAAGDRTNNTDTMYASTNAVQKAMSLTRLRTQIKLLSEKQNNEKVSAELQNKFSRAVYQAVDDARNRRNLRTPDSISQNINDFKNTLIINEALRYLGTLTNEGDVTAEDLALDLHSLAALARRSRFHSEQHMLSLMIHGIRKPLPNDRFEYQRLKPSEANIEVTNYYFRKFFETEGAWHYSTDAGNSAFKPLAGILIVDHCAESEGRSAVPGYAYNANEYLSHAAFYTRLHQIWADSLQQVNSKLLSLKPNKRKGLTEILSQVPVIRGSISLLGAK